MTQLQHLQIVVAVTAGLITAIMAVLNAFLNLWQRRIEHKWRQAETAKKLWDDILNNDRAFTAALLLDGHERPLKEFEGDVATQELIASSLSATFANPNVKQLFIQGAFDALLHSWARIEGFIRNGLVRERDFVTPGEYYARKVLEGPMTGILVPYAIRTGKQDALAFLKRMKRYYKVNDPTAPNPKKN